MKAKKTFLVVILCVVGFSSFAGEFFGSLFMMGRINNNQIQSFPLDVQTGLSLTRNNKADFVLPAGTSSVFGVGYSVGVVVGNNVQFFTFDGSSYTRNNKADFVLPAGASSVFGVGYSVGVVVGNNVQFFTFDGSSYTRNNKADFVLP